MYEGLAFTLSIRLVGRFRRGVEIISKTVEVDRAKVGGQDVVVEVSNYYTQQATKPGLVRVVENLIRINKVQIFRS